MTALCTVMVTWSFTMTLYGSLLVLGRFFFFLRLDVFSLDASAVVTLWFLLGADANCSNHTLHVLVFHIQKNFFRIVKSDVLLCHDDRPRLMKYPW